MKAFCSKLTIKTPECRYRRRSGVFTVNFEHKAFIKPFEEPPQKSVKIKI